MQIVFIEIIILLLLILALFYFFYINLNSVAIFLSFGSVLFIYSLVSSLPLLVKLVLWLIFIGAALIVFIPVLRKQLLKVRVMPNFDASFSSLLSSKSIESERANNTWEQELFSGNPDWYFLIGKPETKLTQEEKQFIDGPVNQFCTMLDEWKIVNEDKDLSDAAWRFIHEYNLLAISVSKQNGGLGFSAYAHSCIIMKIASRSMSAAAIIMAENMTEVTSLYIACITAVMKYTSRNISLYLRLQTHLNINSHQIWYVSEQLERIGAAAYMMDTLRSPAAGSIDQYSESAKALEIVKQYMRPYAYQVIHDAIDIETTSGLCLGSGNMFSDIYHALPILMSVEKGATQNQTSGVSRLDALYFHPFLFKELTALKEIDEDISLKKFDRVFCKHASLFTNSIGLSVFSGLTKMRWYSLTVKTSIRKHYLKLAHNSANFSLIANVVIVRFACAKEYNQHMIARINDMFSSLYLASLVLKFYLDRGEPEREIAFIDKVMQDCNVKFHLALQEILGSLSSKTINKLLQWIIYPLGKPYMSHSDSQSHQIADLLLSDTEMRDQLTGDIYLSSSDDETTVLLEDALQQVIHAAPFESLIRRALRLGKIKKFDLDEAVAKGIVTESEAGYVREARAACLKIFSQQDIFTEDY